MFIPSRYTQSALILYFQIQFVAFDITEVLDS